MKTTSNNSLPYFDESTSRWVGVDGRFTTKEGAQQQAQDVRAAYSVPVRFNLHPVSDSLDKVMGVQAAIENVIKMESVRPQPMPSDIYTAMLLSEYYIDTEGDLEQTITAPMEIGIKPIVVTCKDKKIEREAREVVNQLFLDEITKEIYYCIETYGQAYPLENWKNNELAGLFLLDPKLIWTDSPNMWFTNSGDLAEKLTSIGIVNYEYHGNGEQNSQMPHGTFGISGENMRPIYARKQSWRSYAVPPLRRSFRTLSTRQTLDEMVRATLEGYRNQLWVFKLGSEERRATPAEISFFKAQIEAGAGDRTGHLVWSYDLEVEQHAPRSLDQMLGGDKWEQLTVKLFTERGISVRLVSGNSQTNQDRNIEFDIQLLIERLVTKRRAIEDWLSYIFDKLAIARKWKSVPLVKLGRIGVQDDLLIKNRIQPLYTSGLLSEKTSLEGAGYDYETEVSNKKSTDRGLFSPPASFAQTVVNENGDVKKKTESNSVLPATQQRNDDSKEQERQEVKSNIVVLSDENDDEIFDKWNSVKRGELEPAVFIDWMTMVMQSVGEDAYYEGNPSPNPGSRIEISKNFNTNYLDNLLSDMSVIPRSEYDKLDYRIRMYRNEGYKRGYMWGVQDLMSKRGYIGWRRVLHPELSKSGPCNECLADSYYIHPMTDDWFDHPGGVCTAQGVLFYHSDTSIKPTLVEHPTIRTIRRKVV